mgnify:CR=1 FL=1
MAPSMGAEPLDLEARIAQAMSDLAYAEEREHELATMAAVRASGAEVGVMLDTDVDRCGLIDGMRSPPEPVNKNRLIALCARVALESAGGKGVIVTDPVTSAGMASYIASCGGEHDRFKMGYRNVIDRAAQTQPEPALLAIETSGHSAWKDNRFVDDGTYTAARLIGRLSAHLRYEENELMALDDLETVCADLVGSVTEVNDVLSHQYFTT